MLVEARKPTTARRSQAGAIAHSQNTARSRGSRVIVEAQHLLEVRMTAGPHDRGLPGPTAMARPLPRRARHHAARSTGAGGSSTGASVAALARNATALAKGGAAAAKGWRCGACLGQELDWLEDLEGSCKEAYTDKERVEQFLLSDPAVLRAHACSTSWGPPGSTIQAHRCLCLCRLVHAHRRQLPQYHRSVTLC